MERTYCTKDYQGLSEIFFKQLSKGGNYTIDEAIKELGIFVHGYKKNEKQHNYWVNFKPFDNPKDTPQRWANSIHFASIEKPEESLYVKGMKTQKLQFEALEKAIYRYMDYMGLTDKDRNKIIKKIETRKNKIQ
jgi:hypothetical protein